MQKITPFLWFDHQAEEAVNFYLSLFSNSRIHNITRYNRESAAASGQPEGSVMTVEFELDGQAFVALNGGPGVRFTEAVSFMINCRDQAEVDRMWAGLTAGGGEEVACGWLRDRYGVAWQVTPTLLMDLINSPDPQVASRVMHAMLQMKKIDIAALERARDGL